MVNQEPQQKSLDNIKHLIKVYPDFPKKGIDFLDIFPLFQHPSAVKMMVQDIVNHLKGSNIHVIVGLDSRGFLLGPWIASELNCSFVPVRKNGKLPADCYKTAYEKEYGTDYFEIQKHALRKDDRVVILDDLVATGGSAQAATDLVQMCQATVVENIFIVELLDLQGTKALKAPSYSLFKY